LKIICFFLVIFQANLVLNFRQTVYDGATTFICLSSFWWRALHSGIIRSCTVNNNCHKKTRPAETAFEQRGGVRQKRRKKNYSLQQIPDWNSVSLAAASTMVHMSRGDEDTWLVYSHCCAAESADGMYLRLGPYGCADRDGDGEKKKRKRRCLQGMKWYCHNNNNNNKNNNSSASVWLDELRLSLANTFTPDEEIEQERRETEKDTERDRAKERETERRCNRGNERPRKCDSH
jgi:hypothetical protein